MRGPLKAIAVTVAVLLIAAVGYYIYDSVRPRTTVEKLASIIHDEDRRVLSHSLRDYLESPEAEIRRRAALAVGRIAEKRSGPLLFGMLADSSIDVAVTAAFGLGLTGEKEYAPELLDYAYDLPAAVAVAAVEAAGRLADSSDTDVAASLAEYVSHPSPDVREAACYALFRAGARGQAATLIAVAHEEPDPEVREAALYALARLGIDAATDLYIDNLSDPKPHIRSMCLLGLGRSSSPEAERYLAIAMNDTEQRVVAQAIAGLRRLGTPTAAERLARRLEDESDEKLVIELIEALRALKHGPAISTVYNILATEPPVNIVIAAVKYLATVDDQRGVSITDSIAYQQPEPRIRAACAEAYGIINKPTVIGRLAVLLGDEDPIVRSAAFTGLTEIDPGNLKFYVRQGLGDPYFVVNVLAIDVVKEKQLRDLLPTLQTMIDRGPEVHADIRRSVVDAATPFLKADPKDTAAVNLLIAGILDPDYIVRRGAAGIYKDVLDEDRSDMVAPAATQISESRIARALRNYTYNPHAIMTTSKGEVEIELLFDVAPLTVINFIELADDGFYNLLSFHRVVPNFVVQGGDPMGDGWGGPGYSIRSEWSRQRYSRGTVGIATSGKDTGGSQFFITLSTQPHLEGRYTAFGRVVSGMDAVDEIVQGDLIESIVIQEQGS